MMSTVQLGEERVPEGEAAAIEEIKNISWEIFDASKRPAQRAQHAKHHGCVKAEFIVESALPEELRHGVFKRPRSYEALVRFSNGGKTDDRKGDAHGMAIKLLDVAGSGPAPSTQDFVLADHPVFFIRNAADYAVFTRAFRSARQSRWAKRLSSSPAASAIFLLMHMLFGFFGRGRLHEFGIFLKFVSKKPASPLATQYWSTTPYRLGPHAIRFSARPQQAGAPAAVTPLPDSPDRLRAAMSAHLKSREACFDFLVQLQTDAAAMPVEDPTIAWDEAVSPYRKVATLRIAPQSFESTEQMTHCENLVFAPWHALPEHRALGGINRVRDTVYKFMSKRRHELNAVPLREPADS
jgi:hypothetical protein